MLATVSSLLPFAQIFFPLFAAVTIAGGTIGYLKARSTASLVAGGVSGVLLLVASFLLRGTGARFAAGEVLALVVSLLLLGRFAPALMRGKTMPAAYMVPLALVGAVTAVVLLLGTGPV